MGLTEAVGEEEEDSAAAELMLIREEAGPPSGVLISRFGSSLLLRDTVMVFDVSIFETL